MMTILVGLAMAVPLEWDVPDNVDADVAAALEEARSFPEDYVTMVHLAYSAEASGYGELVVEAWARAEEISGGNLETSAGQVMPLLSLGMKKEARQAAAHAALLAPDSAYVHLLSAEALRHMKPTALSAELSRSSIDRALTLEPDNQLGHCAKGWNRWNLGDAIGARRAMEGANVECPALPEPAGELTGGIWASGRLRTSSSSSSSGLQPGGSLVADASYTFQEMLTLGATGRTLSIMSLGSSIAQHEVWGRAQFAWHGHGIKAVAAGVFIPSNDTGWVVGASAWGTWWATLRGEFVRTKLAEGSGWQGGAALRLPISDVFHFDTGVRYTGFEPAEDSELDRESVSGWTGHGSLIVRLNKGWLKVGGRYGLEANPVRLDEPTLWNLDYPIAASAFVKMRHQIIPSLFFDAGYEWLYLDSDVHSIHTLTIGILAIQGARQ
ncbi:MAG: hypothetical protein HN348_11325 [Proteobacteria bacterium]|nr:hypothetical protein [Pseudomonadota bacterium]